jgi:hypothetical protein
VAAGAEEALPVLVASEVEAVGQMVQPSVFLVQLIPVGEVAAVPEIALLALTGLVEMVDQACAFYDTQIHLSY